MELNPLDRLDRLKDILQADLDENPRDAITFVREVSAVLGFIAMLESDKNPVQTAVEIRQAGREALNASVSVVIESLLEQGDE